MYRILTIRNRSLSPLLAIVVVLFLLSAGGCTNQNDAAKNWGSQTNTAKRQQELVKGEERPATPKTTYAYARILAAQNNYLTCDQILTKLLTQNPKFKEAYLLQAEVRVRMRRVTDAIHTLRVAMRYYPRDDVILNNLGMCLLIKGDCNTSLGCFTEAAALKPSNSRYRANMAMALGLLGRKDESDSLYKMVVSKEDSDHNLSVLNAARTEYLGLPEAAPESAPPPQPAAPANSQTATPSTQPSAPIVIRDTPYDASVWSFLSGSEPAHSDQTPKPNN